MPEYLSHQWQREMHEEWRYYLQLFPWQWLATLTFQDRVQYFPALHMFDRWRLRLIDQEEIRVGGYILCASRRHHLHFHVLMIGQNRFGKTLLDCDPRYWETQWRYFARIEPVTDIPQVTDYVGSHFRGWKADHAEADPFNRTLLRQAMQRHCGFIDNFDGLGCLD